MVRDGHLIQFPVELVRQHASSVDRVSEAMELARSAVHEVTMDTEAYGQLCQFLPAILSPVFGLGLDAMYSSVDSLRETAAKLRAAASSTHSTDVHAEQQIVAAGDQGRPGIRLPL